MANVYLTGSGGLALGGGGVIASAKPAAASIVADVKTGGFALGGAGVLAQVNPGATEVTGEGGFALGGDGGQGKPEVFRPGTKSFTGSGGFLLEGEGALSQVQAPDLPANYLVGSKGFDFGGAGIISLSRPPVRIMEGAGGLRFGGFRLPEVTVTRPGDQAVAVGSPVAFALGGEGVLEKSYPQVHAIEAGTIAFKLSGEGGLSSRYPQVTLILGEGGFVLTGGGQDPDSIFSDTWVLSGNNFEPSYYTGFDFNSFAQFRGRFYGAKEDGIYLLGAEDDDGRRIHSGVRIGPTNLGAAAMKRLRTVTVGECGQNVKVRVQAGGREGVFPVERGRAAISRNLQDREMVIDIADFEQLSHLEIIPLVLARR